MLKFLHLHVLFSQRHHRDRKRDLGHGRAMVPLPEGNNQAEKPSGVASSGAARPRCIARHDRVQ
jgi:hypothetical protein